MLTTKQIAIALQALAEISLRLDDKGVWFVSQKVERSDGMMCTSLKGCGDTLEDALLNHWHLVTNIAPDCHLVVKKPGRNEYWSGRWNGFMWEEKC